MNGRWDHLPVSVPCHVRAFESCASLHTLCFIFPDTSGAICLHLSFSFSFFFFFLRSSHLLPENSWNKWTELETSGITSLRWQMVFPRPEDETTTPDSDLKWIAATDYWEFCFANFSTSPAAPREHKLLNGPHLIPPVFNVVVFYTVLSDIGLYIRDNECPGLWLEGK